MEIHLLKTQEIIKRLVGQDNGNVCRDVCILRTETGAYSMFETKINLLIEQTPPTDRTTNRNWRIWVIWKGNLSIKTFWSFGKIQKYLIQKWED